MTHLTPIATIFGVRRPLYAFMRLCLRFFALAVCGAGSLIWKRAQSGPL